MIYELETIMLMSLNDLKTLGGKVFAGDDVKMAKVHKTSGNAAEKTGLRTMILNRLITRNMIIAVQEDQLAPAQSVTFQPTSPLAVKTPDAPYTSDLADLDAQVGNIVKSAIRDMEQGLVTKLGQLVLNQVMPVVSKEVAKEVDKQVKERLEDAISAAVAPLKVEVQQMREKFEASKTTAGNGPSPAIDARFSELADQQRRSGNLMITRLPESDGETELRLRDTVLECLQITHTDVEVLSVKRVGKPSTSPSPSGTPKPRKVLVQLANVQERNKVLRGRKSLQGTRYRTVGVSEDLTKPQEELRQKAWPAFLEAKGANKRCFWKAEKLFIDGQEHII